MGWRELRARHLAAEAGPGRRVTAPLVSVSLPEPVPAVTSRFAPSNEAPEARAAIPTQQGESAGSDCKPAATEAIGPDDLAELDRLMVADPWSPGWRARLVLAHGRLARVSTQSLARMGAPQLEARADAAAARVYQLEAVGLDESCPELKGLRAELRWTVRHRPEALALHGMTAELITAGDLLSPGAVVTRADDRPIAYRRMETARPVPAPEVMPTAAELRAVGWGALESVRIAGALAVEVAPGKRVGVVVAQEPEKWRRALAADALQGPNGPRAGPLMADVEAIERMEGVEWI